MGALLSKPFPAFPLEIFTCIISHVAAESDVRSLVHLLSVSDEFYCLSSRHLHVHYELTSPSSFQSFIRNDPFLSSYVYDLLVYTRTFPDFCRVLYRFNNLGALSIVNHLPQCIPAYAYDFIQLHLERRHLRLDLAVDVPLTALSRLYSVSMRGVQLSSVEPQQPLFWRHLEYSGCPLQFSRLSLSKLTRLALGLDDLPFHELAMMKRALACLTELQALTITSFCTCLDRL